MLILSDERVVLKVIPTTWIRNPGHAMPLPERVEVTSVCEKRLRLPKQHVRIQLQEQRLPLRIVVIDQGVEVVRGRPQH